MNRLHELETKEISLVPRGANKKRFLVLKATTGESMPKPNAEILKMVNSADPEVMKKVEQVVKDFKVEDDKGGEGSPMTDRAQAAVKAIVRIAHGMKDEIHMGALHQALKAAGLKHRDDEGDDETEEGDESDTEKSFKKDEDVSDEHYGDAMEDAKKSYKAKLGKLGYEKYKPGKDDNSTNSEEDTVSKEIVNKDGSLNLDAVPKEVQPAIEHIFKSNMDLVKKNDTLTAELKKERDERRSKEFVAKADSLKHYVGDKAALAKELQTLSDTSPAAYDIMVKNLEAVEKSAEANKALFREIGSDQGGSEGDPNSFDAKINAIAKGIVEKGDGKLTDAQAYERALSTPEGQQLYAEYKSKRGGI